MRAQLILRSRAVPTQTPKRSSTCEATAAISGRCASSSSSVIPDQGALTGDPSLRLNSSMAAAAQSLQMAAPGLPEPFENPYPQYLLLQSA